MSALLSKTFSFLALTLSFLSCLSFICSLSTVAISETSNQTLVCAQIHSSDRQSYLRCSSFPPGIQIRASSLNASLSGIVAGNGFVCALRSLYSSSISVMGCWRFSANGTDMYFKRIYRDALLKELAAGNSHICGVANGTNGVQCWQWRGFNSSTSHQNFSSIAVGEDFVCGLSEFGNIKCLPIQKNDISSVIGHEPSGKYSLIAAGFRHACAVSLNGSLECWGEIVGVKPSQGEFALLALGENRSCAMRPNGTVTCWGQNNFKLPERLRTTDFITIEAKRTVFCGIERSNYSLYCWGNEILDSNPMVFEDVVPGPCRSACPRGCALPLYGTFCSQGLMICEPCGSEPSAETPPVSPSPQPPRGTAPSGDWNKKTVAFLVVGCVGSLSLVIVCFLLFFRYCKVGGCRVHDSGRLDDQGNPIPIQEGGQTSRPDQAPPPAVAAATPVLEKRLSQLVSMGNGGSHLEEFSLQVLLQSTDNFADDHKIGTGSFGSVYHATLDDGRQVAIKRAEASTSSSYAVAAFGTKLQEEDKDNAFLNELEFLSRLNHKNLVRLLGYCEDSNERILVYEYMNNGTLSDQLHKQLKSSPLMSWAARIKVALDAARGIEYLHEYAVPPIIHRDIKSSNILLDATWTAKVSDFGLSLMGPDDESHLSMRAAGTIGYMDPGYYRSQKLTAKSDVYSFGVVLLELLSGHKAIHRNENGVPRNVVDFVVPYIVQDEIHRILDRNVPAPTPFEIEPVAYVGYLAADCVMLEGRDRPTMTEIVNKLEIALGACLAPPSLSRSRSITTGSST